MNLDRYKPPCAEDEVVVLDHEEELFYCQHCGNYFVKDEMMDVEYEMCNECFEVSADHWRKWPKIKKELEKWANELLENPGSTWHVITISNRLLTYVKGL